MEMNESEFVFGWELQGRGSPTPKDIIIGSFMFIVSIMATIFGILNIYIIYKTPIFNNAFGWFWASRTSVEVISNVVNLLFAAPMTIIQPRPIPIALGIIAYTVGFGCTIMACLMHQGISTNRLIAVYKPVQYKYIFTKQNSFIIIFLCCAPVPFIFSLYFIIDCSMLGYSPLMYEYIFVSCAANFHRRYSMVGTVVNRFCTGLCILTLVTDCATFYKIMRLRNEGTMRNDQNHSRDIRFFAQSSIQNVTMILALIFIVIANNEYSLYDEHWRILGYNTILVTHFSNALALILLNPEARKRICCCSLRSARVSDTEISYRIQKDPKSTVH